MYTQTYLFALRNYRGYVTNEYSNYARLRSRARGIETFLYIFYIALIF